MFGNIISKARNFVSGVVENINGKVRAVGVTAVVVGVPMAARAEGTIDLSSVTTGITDTKVAILAIAGTVIAAGLALGAVKFGGKWAVKLWKSMTG